MLTYDVYLKNRLTEIDVIITQLIQRDVLLAYNKLFIWVDPINAFLVKQIDGEFKSFLTCSANEITKCIHELCAFKNHLLFSSDMCERVSELSEFETDIFVNEIEVVKGLCTELQDELQISIEPLDYYIGHSLGNAYTSMMLQLNNLEFQKTGFEAINFEFYLVPELEMAARKVMDFDRLLNYLRVDQTNIFYRCDISGETSMDIYTIPIKDYALKKVIYGTEISLSLDSHIDSDFILLSYVYPEILAQLICGFEEEAKKYIDAVEHIKLSCEINAGLKRYRLLSDMDEHSLCDFDDMTLAELDYVILAE